MDFPHLKDTNFPIIDNVNVYKYQNNFDYARWQGKVSFKLLNVLWNSNYADVPYFETVEIRDKWFENEDGYVGTLESLFNSTPNDRIRIPIPYNEAYYYNYIMIDMPLQTSENNQINYEDKNRRVSKWFYFIEDMIQYAPNTTELVISVDYWTTFINSVDIPYLMLERGHAPMTKTTVQQYLNNPIENNEYLLAADFNYGNDTIVSGGNYEPIGNGVKYVLFCAPYASQDFPDFLTTAFSGGSTGPTYSDGTARNGYQALVSNYDWHYGNRNYSNASLPVRNEIQTGILSGCECFAILGTQAREFFNKCADECPQFIRGIQAMFMLDENMFTKGNSFTFMGYTLYIADRKIQSYNFNFSIEQFNFDDKYKNITKLYTSPYSYLEVTDDEGNSFTAKIENCANDVVMRREVSLVYPYLNYNILFHGINGNDTRDYIWKSVSNSDNEKNIWMDDFSKFMMNWKIPTYSLYVSGLNEYSSHNYNKNQAKRANAMMNYTNNTRIANTAYENAEDLADTIKTNSQAITTTTRDNNNRTNKALMDNMLNTCSTKSYILDELQYKGDYYTGAGFYPKMNYYNLNKITDEQNADANYVTDNIGLDMDYASATSTNNAAAAVASGWITGVSNGLATGFSGGGGVAGGAVAAGSILNGYVQSDNIQQNNVAFLAKETGSQFSYSGYLLDKFTILNNYTSNIYAVKKAYASDLLYQENLLDKENTGRMSNNGDVTGMSLGSNIRNSNAIYNTEWANANRLYNTNEANAGYTRITQVNANKNILSQQQLEVASDYKDAALNNPLIQGSYGGDFYGDVYERRGIRFNIRTQSKSAIAQAGDAFLRFGYALHRVWDMHNGFHYGKHYTFWKAEDIWINDGSGVANAATNVIGNILLKGVTVWKNPHEIGCVGIYDNI